MKFRPLPVGHYRGSGKTVGEQVSLERLVTDTCESVSLLRPRYPGLCEGFISAGQLVAGAENEVLSHRLAAERARGLLRYALLAGRPPYGPRADALLRRCFYLYLLGGFFRRRCAPRLTLLVSCEYTVADKLAYPPRFRASLKQLQPTLETLDLLTAPLKLGVPTLFCVGRRDLVTPPELAERLSNHVKAPHKRFEVSDGEAYCLHYENPGEFAQVLRNWLRAEKDRTTPPVETRC